MIRTPSAALGEQASGQPHAILGPLDCLQLPDPVSADTQIGRRGTDDSGCGLHAHRQHTTADSQDLPHQPPTALAVLAGMAGCRSQRRFRPETQNPQDRSGRDTRDESQLSHPYIALALQYQSRPASHQVPDCNRIPDWGLNVIGRGDSLAQCAAGRQIRPSCPS